MFKNNIKIHTLNIKYTRKKVSKILLKTIPNQEKKCIIKIININLNKNNYNNINKKCIITNKKKKLFKNLNISRWFLDKIKLKWVLNKW